MTIPISFQGQILFRNGQIATDIRCCCKVIRCATTNAVFGVWDLSDIQYDITDLQNWDEFTDNYNDSSGESPWILVTVWHNFNTPEPGVPNQWRLRFVYMYWINCDTSADAFTFAEDVRTEALSEFGIDANTIGDSVFSSQAELELFIANSVDSAQVGDTPGVQQIIRNINIEQCPCL